MRHSLRRARRLTEGERARALAFFLVGLGSAALGYLAVLHLDQGAMFEGLSRYETWIVAASGLGGMAALFLSGDRLGQSGTVGALRGLAGAIWVTFVGALIGGTLGLPFYGTMFGPFIVCVTLAGAPILASLWFFNLFAVHILFGIYQQERDSIFIKGGIGLAEHPDGLRSRMTGRYT